MKRDFLAMMALAAVMTLSACDAGGDAPRQPGKPGSVNDILASASAGAAEGSSLSTENAFDAESAKRAEESISVTTKADIEKPQSSENDRYESAVDVDLTVLSGTVVYSEVYNMMVSPENYLGKTVRMKGPFAVYQDESTGKYYFACIIQDATACCSQGIEFELQPDRIYPDDYPAVGDDICVAGVFDTYLEGEYMYCTLRDAVIE